MHARALTGIKRPSLKVLAAVTAAGVIVLSILGVSFTSIVMYAAVPAFFSFNAHLARDETLAPRGISVEQVQELLRTGKPVPAQEGHLSVVDGQLEILPEDRLFLPISLSGAPSELQWSLVHGINRIAGPLLMTVFAATLAMVHLEAMPWWWILLILALAGVAMGSFLVAGTGKYSVPPGWKIEFMSKFEGFRYRA